MVSIRCADGRVIKRGKQGAGRTNSVRGRVSVCGLPYLSLSLSSEAKSEAYLVHRLALRRARSDSQCLKQVHIEVFFKVEELLKVRHDVEASKSLREGNAMPRREEVTITGVLVGVGQPRYEKANLNGRI